MNVFKDFPKKSKCPICGTNKDKESVLIGIDGTQEGKNIQAQVFHLDCLDLMYNEDMGFIYQKVIKNE